MTAINFPSSPSNGDTFVAGSVTYTYNSTKQYWDALPTAPLNTNFFSGVTQHITPGTDNTYDLGSSTHKWRSLYVDAGTIHIGSQTIKATSSGIELPELTIGTGTTKVKLGVAADGSLDQTATVSGTEQAATKSVSLTDLSVTTASAGTAGLTYTNTTGVFAYTPPDLSGKADLASPTLTGTPAAPTAVANSNTNQIATTAYVDSGIAAIVDTAPATLNTLNEIAAALGDDANYAATTTSAIGLKAPLASPTFTGVAAAPTASVGTNTTQLATTAFVTAATAGSGGSGGSIELTANGAISAGKAVVIDTAGTVSQVTNPPDFLQTTEQVGPTTTYNSNGGHTFYNKVKNRHVTLTAPNSGTAYVTAFTRSGTALSYGAVVNVTSNDTYTTYGAPYLIIDNVSGREFIIKASQDGIVYYSELGGTGNTVSVGGQQQIWNPGISDQHTTAFASGSKVASFGGGEFMIPVFTRATTGATVFTISTISMVIPATGVPNFGTPTQIGATDGFKIINDGGGLKIVEDVVDNTKGLIQYHDSSGALKMSAVTFSGTGTSRTISAIGTGISTIDNNNQGMGTICNIKGLADKFMAVQRSGEAAKAAVVSVSGTTATLHSSVTILDTASTADLPGDIISSSANDGEVISWNQKSGWQSYSGSWTDHKGSVYVRTLQVSGNSITMGTNQLVKEWTSSFYGSSPADSAYHAGYSISAEVDDNPGVYILVHGTPGGGNGSYQKKTIAYPYGVNQLSNKAEWVGISKAAAADGATVGIDLPGGINENQSGMTIEGTYYVQNDGDIETGVTTEVAGVALSATKLLVADNTTNSQANIPLSSFATTAVVNAKANISSPTFTGTPAAPTASVGTNTTQLATTAFVLANTGGTTYTAISSATTAVAGNAYIVDTGTAVTVTLPASAAIGDTVAVIDGTGTAATNNITIGRNSHKIQGDAADMTVSLNRAAFELVYYNATHGWLLTKV